MNIMRLQYITVCTTLRCLQIKSLKQLIGPFSLVKQYTYTMNIIIISTGQNQYNK